MRIVHQCHPAPRTTIIVVPCFNEARRLQLFDFQRFVRRNSRIQILFVNDGSTDETFSVLDEFRREQPDSVRLLSLPSNQGKAEAVRVGLLTGLQSGPDYLGYWDADLATPLEEIRNFQRVLDLSPGIQAVVGSRLPLLGRSISRNYWRSMLGRGFAAAASLTLGFRIQDTQCGAKLFRSSTQLEAALSDRFCSRWIFDVELLARLVALLDRPSGECLYEQPLETWNEIPGSKLKLKHFVRAVGELASICWNYSGRRLQHYCKTTRAHSLPSIAPADVAASVARTKAA